MVSFKPILDPPYHLVVCEFSTCNLQNEVNGVLVSQQQTASRAGWSGAMRSQGRGDAGPRVLQPEKHQLARYWDPVAYRQWQDEALAKSGR